MAVGSHIYGFFIGVNKIEALKSKKNSATPRQFQKSGPVVLPALAEMLDPFCMNLERAYR